MYKRQQISLHIDGNFSLLGKKGNHFWREIIAQQTAQVEDLGLYMLQLQDGLRAAAAIGHAAGIAKIDGSSRQTSW